MKKIKYLYMAMAGLLLVTLAGCAAGPKLATGDTITLPGADREKVMAVAEDVLARMQFVVEKYDVDRGLITTMPLRGAQFFEFWRKDNVTAKRASEANMHSVQRTAELSISGSDPVTVKCNVRTRRLSIPEKNFRGISEASSMFTNSSRSLQKLKLNPEQQEQMAWIDLGADPDLAGRILGMIEQKVTRFKDKR